ncbi:hypothetical protein BS47DRAFT_562525 [Hydnum rufescens UP504]|uniref:Uncharacterized protein n=1 Tax=Hydnum rufescens UP504 TaxID=1448309 RepID=A0A9P6AGD6_9AGAM|nr:hypothetical protein BS47DRAFT_562525 [Hydnum rufescens UP504]
MAFTSGAAPDFNTGVTIALTKKDVADKRPNWSPSTLEEVSPAYVWDTFFNPTSPYIRRIQTERTSAELDLGYYALPSESDIGMFALGNTTDSRASGVSAEEVVVHLEAKMRGTSGVRFKEKGMLARCCETIRDGRLKWR